MRFPSLEGVSTGAADGVVMIELQKAGVPFFSVESSHRMLVQTTLVGGMAFSGAVVGFFRKSSYWHVRFSVSIGRFTFEELERRSRGRVIPVRAKGGPQHNNLIAVNVHYSDDLIEVVGFLYDIFGDERQERTDYGELVAHNVLNGKHYLPPKT